MLEYRLWKGNEQYEAIYHFDRIDYEQVFSRRECEFFVKEGITYKQVSSAKEEEMFIIYVEIFEEAAPEEIDLSGKGSMKLEIREYNPLRDHPVMESLYLDNHMQVLGYIGSTFTYFHGKEWKRDSAEIDEDRMVYALYVTATGLDTYT
ncbi:hypothetical protein ELQ35_21605 [Peribacillus cavernae]|uniref:Uncharacterized protein n=1 Tax=Peribacillus cavernae TaxID=1674310 RepID=A0A3S0TWP5_9BACI|nr:hypothetical protein ELQ35_21605 [Peribacillus cavernae]